MDDSTAAGQERFRKFLKVFSDISESTANMAAVAKKQIELTNRLIDAHALLFEAIAKDKDGLVCAVDDLIAEIQGLRDDLRAFARVGGFGAQLGALLQGRGRRGG